VFANFLSFADAQRVSVLLAKLSAHGFRGALAGGLAAQLHLVSQGRETPVRALNDLDFVVESFASIPFSLADEFLINHPHPRALEGKTLLQLIDREQRLRVDLFRQFGATLTRTEVTRADVLHEVTLISLEDLVARTTSLVLGHLRKGTPMDAKHIRTFECFAGLGDPARLDIAWRDHRQSEKGSFHDSAELTQRLLDLHPELAIDERYSAEVTDCPQCQDEGPFRRARPEAVVEILGYW
jgi:hypothetical protein